MKKTAGLTALALVTALLLTSCKYRLRIEKVEDDTTAEPTVEVTTETPETEEYTTLDPLTEAGVVYDSASFRAVAMDKAAVLALYTTAMNNVKNRCPGFTKKDYQSIGDVTAGNGRLQLANRILNLVATEVLQSTGDSNAQVVVKAHEDVKVVDSFPLYGESVGCTLENTSILSSAVCYTDGTRYKIVITVADTLNPEPGVGDFYKILTPVARQKVAEGIASYLVVLDNNKYKFDFNYTGNEIICVFDIASGRMEYLSQKMLVNVDIDLDLDLLLVQTDFIKAKGTVVNHIEYTDFDWSEE
ncbi:MAG: hypothetical protein IJT27_03620 [Clostridia bacterium]|nr:hypothetical protein [Clostridia bacterium]